MDFVEARLHACCSSLGFFDEAAQKYIKEPDCELSCKELIRSLKREDETRQVRRKIGFLKVFENDLVSILCNYVDDTSLFDTVIRLMQNLSSPAILCFGSIPTDPLFMSYYLELECYLRNYKKAFTNETLIYNIGLRVKTLLESEDGEDEESQLLLERILILYRNILHVNYVEDEKRTDDDASLHDQIIWAFQKTGVEAIIKYLATNESQSKWCMHILEILFHMLRDQSPELLASVSSSTDQQEDKDNRKGRKEKEIEAKEFCSLLLKNKNERMQKSLRTSTRHSRFGGSYYVKNLPALNPMNDLIYHGPPNQAQFVSFDDLKNHKRKPKRLQPVADHGVPRRSTKVIRQFLKELVNDLLEHSFNTLLHAASDAIQREKIQYNDESYFLWAIGFFLEFNRCYKFKPELISEILSSQIFNYIHLKLGEYYEMMRQEKKAKYVAISWAERMHFALKAFSEMLKTTERMGMSESKELQRSADILKRNLFYNSEYRDLFTTLMQRFDQTKMSRSYLRDLIESNHTFLKMLEIFVSRKKLVIKKKGKKKKPAKSVGADKPLVTKSSANAAQKENNSKEDELEALWDNIAPSLSSIFQKRIEPPEQSMMPFDPLSDLSLDQQKEIAVARIQRLLRSVKSVTEPKGEEENVESEENVTAAKVIELLRECRNVWPTGDVFGGADEGVEAEFMVLRTIHFAETVGISEIEHQVNFRDLDTNPTDALLKQVENEVGSDEENGGDKNEALEEELMDAGLISESSSDGEGQRQLDSNEQYFDFQSYIQQYARPGVVSCYGYILKFFKSNFSQTNKAVVKMLHRIACDLNMPGLLFQASLFRVFREILREASLKMLAPGSKIDSITQELVIFAKYIVKIFVRAANNNPKLFMELIFWKDTSVACEIIDGYGTYVKHGRSDNIRIVFSEEDNAEITRLFKEYQESEQDEAQGGVVEYIMSNFSRELHRPKAVASQLKSLGLVSDMNELRMVSGRENAGIWRPEHETELEFLWNQFKESEDPLSEIYNAMVQKRPKVRIVQKLLMMGWAKSKNEIIKPDIWPHELIEELKNLFTTHKDDTEPLRLILDNISVAKSRKQILNKLVDIKLISNVSDLNPQKSGIPSRKSGKQEKVWNEDDILELKELFGKYNTLKLIMEHKTFEAPRKEVMNKLKELNLNYRQGASKKGKGLNFLEANNLLQEGDFEEEMARRIAQKKASDVMSKRGRKDLKNIVNHVRDLGLADALDWLKTSLNSALEAKQEIEDDADEDYDETESAVSFPLVPQGNTVEKAIEKKEFKKIMETLGLSPPTGNDEIFWRVPAYLKSDVLRKKVEAFYEACKVSQNGAGSDYENDLSKKRLENIDGHESSDDSDNPVQPIERSPFRPVVSSSNIQQFRKESSSSSEDQNESVSKTEERKRRRLSELKKKSMKRRRGRSETPKSRVEKNWSNSEESNREESKLQIAESSDSNSDDSSALSSYKRRKLNKTQAQNDNSPRALEFSPRAKSKKLSRLQRIDFSDESDENNENDAIVGIMSEETSAKTKNPTFEGEKENGEETSDQDISRKRKRRPLIDSSDDENDEN